MKLDDWWASLTDEQRAGLLPLEAGQEVPAHLELAVAAVGLPRRLDAGGSPAGAGVVSDDLAGYLAERRAEE